MIEQVKGTVRKFAADEDGAAMAEYGLLIALVALAAAVATATLGTDIKNLFTAISTELKKRPG